MYKYNIYIGQFDKDTKTQVLSNTEFLNTVREVMRTLHIDNYTIYKCKGHYKHQDGKIVCEPSINVEIIQDGIMLFQKLNSIKVRLCNELNQESVLITKQEIQVL